MSIFGLPKRENRIHDFAGFSAPANFGAPAVAFISGPGVDFNSLEKANKIIKEFVDTAPDWRAVVKGLNLEARCVTPSCQAFEKLVWVSKGMGKFNILQLIFDGTHCPLCNQNTANAENVGYNACTYTVDGKMIAPERKVVHYSDIAPPDKLTTFKHSQANWLELTITTEEL